MSDTGEQKLLDLPPSAKLVFIVIEQEQPLTHKQIVEKTRLSERTTRYALDRLKEVNAIDGEINLADLRQILYTTQNASSTEIS